MAHHLRNEQCPKCASKGEDRSGNNLGIYSDGSSYCWKCGSFSSGNSFAKYTQKEYPVVKTITLPSDVTDDLPEIALTYLQQFGITKTDISVHTLMWSDYQKRLIFPYFDGNGLIAWQGRYLGTELGKPKWFSQGKLQEILHVIGNKRAKRCILVEDVLSAMRISHVTSVCAVPLFGSYVSTTRMLQLRLLFDTIDVWLDYDKAKESTKYSKNLRDFGVKSYSILTFDDPKCLLESIIADCLGENQTEA